MAYVTMDGHNAPTNKYSHYANSTHASVPPTTCLTESLRYRAIYGIVFIRHCDALRLLIIIYLIIGYRLSTQIVSNSSHYLYSVNIFINTH